MFTVAVDPAGIVPKLHVTVWPEIAHVPSVVVMVDWHGATLQ